MTTSQKESIIFSNVPFESNPTPQKKFKEGSSIYGRLILEQPIRDFCKAPDDYARSAFKTQGEYNHLLTFYVRPIEEDVKRRTNCEIKLYVKDADLDKTMLDFDVTPNEQQVTSLFAENSTFINELANTSSTYPFFNSKVEFIVELKNKNYGQLFYDDTTPEPTGKIIIDLSVADYRSQNTWKENVERCFKKIWKQYFKLKSVLD